MMDKQHTFRKLERALRRRERALLGTISEYVDAQPDAEEREWCESELRRAIQAIVQSAIDRARRLAEVEGAPQPGPGEVVLTTLVSREKICLPAREISIPAASDDSAAGVVSCCVLHGNTLYVVRESLGEIQALVDAALAALGEAEPTVTLHSEGRPYKYRSISSIEEGPDGSQIVGEWWDKGRWVDTGMGHGIDESPAEVTRRARKVWPDFSCPGCVEPVVVLHTGIGSECRWVAISCLIDPEREPEGGYEKGGTIVIGTDTSRCGEVLHVAMEAADIRAACAAAGVPCVAEEAEEPPAVVFPRCSDGASVCFTAIEEMYRGCSKCHEVHGKGKDGEAVMHYIPMSKAAIRAACAEAGVPCVAAEPEAPTVTLHPAPGFGWIPTEFRFTEITTLLRRSYGSYVEGIIEGKARSIEIYEWPDSIRRWCAKAHVPCPPEEPTDEDEDDRCCRDCSYYGPCDMADWRCRLEPSKPAKIVLHYCDGSPLRMLVDNMGDYYHSNDWHATLIERARLPHVGMWHVRESVAAIDRLIAAAKAKSGAVGYGDCAAREEE